MKIEKARLEKLKDAWVEKLSAAHHEASKDKPDWTVYQRLRAEMNEAAFAYDIAVQKKELDN